MSFFPWFQRLIGHSKTEIPEPLWQTSIECLSFLHRLKLEERRRLKQMAETFLDEKSVTGAGGLQVSDEIAVLLAVQACLPVLNLTLDLYDDMSGVIVYPSGFIVPHHEIDETGVVHEWREPLAGEAIDAGGAVVLSWEDMDPVHQIANGCNVVIHEFVHKIDMMRGGANGCPPFLANYHHGMDVRRWQQSFSTAYDDFCRRVDTLSQKMARSPALPEDEPEELAELPMDDYAATNPAEFFAVASETFFVTPMRLARAYPQVYHLLADYYRQQPCESC